jgi:hypothetical protein
MGFEQLQRLLVLKLNTGIRQHFHGCVVNGGKGFVSHHLDKIVQCHAFTPSGLLILVFNLNCQCGYAFAMPHLEKRGNIAFVWSFVDCLFFYIKMLCEWREREKSIVIEKNNNFLHVNFSGRLNIYNILEDISYGGIPIFSML